MGKLVLINPSNRRSAVGKRRKTRKTRKARRRNPVPTSHSAIARKARAVLANARRRRRRNPALLGGAGMGDLKTVAINALVGGAGAVAVDAVMGQVRPMLPASLSSGYAYTATKAVATVALAVIGRKALGPVATRAAQGALTCQARDLIAGAIGSSVPMGAYVGAYSPGMIARPGNAPARRLNFAPSGVGALGAYMGARRNTVAR